MTPPPHSRLGLALRVLLVAAWVFVALIAPAQAAMEEIAAPCQEVSLSAPVEDGSTDRACCVACHCAVCHAHIFFAAHAPALKPAAGGARYRVAADAAALTPQTSGGLFRPPRF